MQVNLSMQTRPNPLGRAALRAVFAFAVACAGTGCADDRAAAVATTISVATPSPDPALARDRDTAWIYHLSKAHETDDLVGRLDGDRRRIALTAAVHAGAQPHNVLAIEPPHSPPPIVRLSPGPAASATPAATAPSRDPLAELAEPLDPAVVLALYHIDPATYKELFIENYPTTPDAVQHDFGDRLARASLTPDGEAYPIVELERQAATSEVAAAKLYEAASVADGELADRYAVVIAQFAKGHPASVLPMLVRLPMATQLATVSEPAGWCRFRPESILAGASDDLAQLAIQRDLRTTVTGCGRLAALARAARASARAHSRHHRRGPPRRAHGRSAGRHAHAPSKRPPKTGSRAGA